MPIVEFVGQSAKDDDNIAADPSRLVNLYRERAGDGVSWLKSVPGTEKVVELPGVFVEAMGNVDGSLYAVCGGRLHRVNLDGSSRNIGALDHGPATICGNNGSVCVQAGTRYFVFDGSVLIEPVTGAFEDIGSCEYFENYTILTEAGGRMFQWSGLADPDSLPGLNFSTADGRDDNLVRAIALHGQLYLFKERSFEVWFNTGQAGAAAFSRVTGGVFDVGLRGHGMITRFPGAAFMVGSDGRAHLVGQGALQPVSTPAVETAIAQSEPVRCVSYADEGHDFCAIIFKDRAAWIYDISTGEWHERAEGASLSPWSASASARLGSEWVIGRNDGSIYALRRSNSDDTAPLVREATSRTLYLDGNRTSLQEIEFFARQGFAPAEVMMAISRDRGMTWTPWKQRPASVQGEYGRRLIWRRQGQARSLTVKIRMTDAVEAPISSQARVVV